MTTPVLGLTELIASQSQPHIPLNTAIRSLETIAQITALGIENDPPLSPTDGDTYIVGDAPTDDWVGHEDEVAVLIGGGWSYFTPLGGWVAFVVDESKFYYYDPSVPEWAFMIARGIPLVTVSGDTTIDSVHNGVKLVIEGSASPGPEITIPIQASNNLSNDHTTTIINMAANDVTIVMEVGSPQDELFYAPDGAVTTITMPQYSVVNITKIGDTQWFATGSSGVTAA